MGRFLHHVDVCILYMIGIDHLTVVPENIDLSKENNSKNNECDSKSE